MIQSRDSVTKLRGGGLGFGFWQGKEVFISSKSLRPDFGPIKLPIQWGGETAGHEADHLSA